MQALNCVFFSSASAFTKCCFLRLLFTVTDNVYRKLLLILSTYSFNHIKWGLSRLWWVLMQHTTAAYSASPTDIFGSLTSGSHGSQRCFALEYWFLSGRSGSSSCCFIMRVTPHGKHQNLSCLMSSVDVIPWKTNADKQECHNSTSPLFFFMVIIPFFENIQHWWL